MTKSLRPIDRRRLLREIERLRRANQIFLRSACRKHRPHLVLFAIDPRNEQHLHGAAAIPVALFKIWSDAADTGAESLRDDRCESGITLRGDRQLPFSSR